MHDRALEPCCASHFSPWGPSLGKKCLCPLPPARLGRVQECSCLCSIRPPRKRLGGYRPRHQLPAGRHSSDPEAYAPRITSSAGLVTLLPCWMRAYGGQLERWSLRLCRLASHNQPAPRCCLVRCTRCKIILREQGPQHDLNPTFTCSPPQIQKGTWFTGPQCFTSSARQVSDHSSFRLTGRAMRIM
jgi:hypothetical protein